MQLKALLRAALCLVLLSVTWCDVEGNSVETNTRSRPNAGNHVLENGRIVSQPVKRPLPIDQVERAEMLQDDVDRSNVNYVAQGDILIRKEQLDSTDSKRVKRKVIAETNRFGTSNRWPRGVVPYEFQIGTNDWVKQNVLRAIQHWHQQTCIRFEPYDAQRHWDINAKITIEGTGSGCATYVGYQPSSDGTLSSYSVYLPLICPLGSAIHELGHVIGFYHEMARIDRDSEIILRFRLMSNSEATQYDIMPNPMPGYYGQPYDLSSIMHYRPTEVMTAQDSRRVFLMGQRDALSFLDSKLANLAYHCSDRCTSPPLCFNEGYVNQFCKCTCADGFYGKQCELLQGYSAAARSLPSKPATTTVAPTASSTTTTTAGPSNTTGLHWLEWNDWSNCSEPCGSGIRVRTRLCSNTSIQGSENPCATLGGGSFEIEACRNPDCQNDDIILSCTFDLDGEKCPSEDWAIRTGTQGDQTRPLGDHTRGDGRYLLFVSETNRSSDVKPLRLGPFARTTLSGKKEHCLRFWYSAHENAVGRLSIVKNQSKDLALTFAGKDQNNNWQQIQQTISSDDDYELLFEYQPDSTEYHHIAIDDISLVDGACQSVSPARQQQRRKRRQEVDGCSRVIDLNSKNRIGTFSSPNYPSLYPANQKCYYYIRAPQGNRILLQFTDFNIPYSQTNDCDDKVEIRYYHLGQAGPTYCGTGANSENLRFVSTKIYVMVVFRTNQGFAGRGFRAQATLTS